MRCNCGADRECCLTTCWQVRLELLVSQHAGAYGSKLNQLMNFGLGDAATPLLRPTPSIKLATDHVRNCRLCWRA